jgi:hypothetical protein
MKEKKWYEMELIRINNYLDNAKSQEEINFFTLKRENVMLQVRNEELLKQLTNIELSKPIVMYCCDKHKKSILDKER